MLYTGDAANVLISHVADKSIKLFYGSPPYARAKRNYGSWTGEEWLDMMMRHLSAMTNKVRDDGFIVVNTKSCREPGTKGGSSYRKRWIERLLIWVEDNLPLHAVDDEIWVKTNPVTTGLRACSQDAWEYVFIWAKSNPWSWNIDALRREYSEKSLQRYTSTYKPMSNGLGYNTKEKREANPLGALPINIVTGSVASIVKDNFHQARQPDYLSERYIKGYSSIGDSVYDPWMGSGTTLKVAKRLGRIPCGSDLDSNYVERVLAMLETE